MKKLEERVKIIPRRLVKDERGWFFKATGTEENIPAHTGEVYLTMGLSGETKGSHYHLEAVEWFTVIAGNAILKLEDVYTHECMEIQMSLEKAISVFVPNNVAHAFVNESEDDFIGLYR